MTRIVLLLALVPGLAKADWIGTIARKPVTCVEVLGPAFSSADFVTGLGLWCTGTPRHSLQMAVFSEDCHGTLRLQGKLCAHGTKTKNDKHTRRQHGRCCVLTGGGENIEGDFQPAAGSPIGCFVSGARFLPVFGHVTSLKLGMSCRHLVFPLLPPTIDLHSTSSGSNADR